MTQPENGTVTAHTWRWQEAQEKLSFASTLVSSSEPPERILHFSDVKPSMLCPRKQINLSGGLEGQGGQRGNRSLGHPTEGLACHRGLAYTLRHRVSGGSLQGNAQGRKQRDCSGSHRKMPLRDVVRPWAWRPESRRVLRPGKPSFT